MKTFTQRYLLTLLFGVSLLPLTAQNKSEVHDSIYSEVLQEQRAIEIILPNGYADDPEKKYEVVYLVDGEWNLTIFSFIHSFAMEDFNVQPVILVALPNTYIDGQNMRDRDFLPLEMKHNPRAGEGAKFLEFLKVELVPYINATYSTSGVNSLYGHSYGGVFAVYALLNEPDLFDTYYSSDPPLAWENNYIIKSAKEMFAENPKMEKKLWISGTTNNFSIGAMKSVLDKHAPKKLSWKTATYPNEKHNSVRLKGIYDGVKFSNK